MIQLNVAKKIFEDILCGKEKILIKEFTPYWKKELLEPKIFNDKITYSIKEIKKIKVLNGLGSSKPLLIIECNKINYNTKDCQFEFSLGSILEQKNTTSVDLRDDIIKELLKEKKEMQDIMFRDYLTGLYNRYKMKDDLNSFVNRIDYKKLSAVFVDADKFKNINDTYGHDAGDEALKYLSSKLQEYAFKLDGIVYRYGGEEFIILCFKEEKELLEILNNLRVDIKSEQIPNIKERVYLSVSMGVSFYKNAKSKENLIKLADDAVYKAKANGRNRIEVCLN